MTAFKYFMKTERPRSGCGKGEKIARLIPRSSPTVVKFSFFLSRYVLIVYQVAEACTSPRNLNQRSVGVKPEEQRRLKLTLTWQLLTMTDKGRLLTDMSTNHAQ